MNYQSLLGRAKLLGEPVAIDVGTYVRRGVGTHVFGLAQIAASASRMQKVRVAIVQVKGNGSPTSLVGEGAVPCFFTQIT